MSRMLAAVFLLALAAPLPAQTDSVRKADSAKAAPKAAQKKKPSVLKAMVGAVADTVGSAAAATVIDTLSGSAGKAVGSRMGAGGTANGGCPQGYVPAAAAQPGGTTGQVLVGAAKKAASAAKAAKSGDSTATPPTPDAPPAQPQCVPAPGYPATDPQMQQQGPGFNPAMMTPAGAVITAAPLAVEGGKAAAKAVRGMFGGNPKSKFDILKDLEGKGVYELRGFRFLPNMDVLDEGYDPHMPSLVEALGTAKGPYGIHIQPEAPKGEEPDGALAAARLEKLAILLLAGGVPESVFAPDGAVPEELRPEPGKVAKPGEAKIWLVKIRARKAAP